jgi:SAM-dependent methyltransferase
MNTYGRALRLRTGIAGAVLIATLSLVRAQDRPAKSLDIHYTPTRHAIADAMLELAKVTAADVVYDLGSGDGRIPIIAAQKYGARGIGIELDAALVERSRLNARDAGVSHRVTFLIGDLFTADMSEATVITLYLSRSINAALEPRLRALRPGTRIVSHQFPIGRWPPDTTRPVDESTLLLWRVP